MELTGTAAEPVFERVTTLDCEPVETRGPKLKDVGVAETEGDANEVPVRFSCVVLPAKVSVAKTSGPTAEGEYKIARAQLCAG